MAGQILKALIIWGLILSLLLAGAGYLAMTAPSALTPNSNPPSIREGSARRGRTRFFVGGGLRGGK